MANKRVLKKAIHGVCDELFAEAVALMHYGEKGQKENAKAQLYAIAKMEDEVFVTGFYTRRWDGLLK